MGWTFMERPRDVKTYFREQLTWGGDHSTNRCLDVALTLNVAYAAVETRSNETGEREVWAAVILIKYVKARDGLEFGYKDMSESMGPVESACPARILDLLTPTDSENANEWRRRCRATLEQRGKARSLKSGSMIEFEAPVRFDDDFEGKRFTIEMVPRGWRGRRQKVLRGENGGLYRVRGLSRRTDWRVIQERA